MTTHGTLITSSVHLTRPVYSVGEKLINNSE
jgi:hypothetical protein